MSGVLDGQTLTDIRIETPSADRVKAPCRHYGACWGCQLQHASDAFVAGWKVDVVRAACQARSLNPQFRPLATSPDRSRRRATFSARRTKKAALAGFHARASDVVVEIPECRLLEPDLLTALPVVEALAIAGASRKGALSVTVTQSAAGLDFAVSGGKPLDNALMMELAGLLERHKMARLAWGDEVIGTRLSPYQTFGGVRVTPPAGAFLQATHAGERALCEAVLEIFNGAKRVADLFAGSGTFSFPIAEHAEVLAVEGDAEMMRALDAGWRHSSGLKRVVTETRDLFRRPLLPEELADFDAVVIDPPRAGAEAQVAQIAQSGVPIVAFVSCNPVTFARDAQMLTDAGYTLNWVQVVDQFRWSTHVELAASFSLSDMEADQ